MTSRWLRLLRIHTSSLTQPVVLLGLVLAGAGFDWTWILFAVFAVLFHGSGFLLNALLDLDLDREDPAKHHFPLVSGEITPNHARILYFILTAATFILGIGLSKGRLLSVLFMLTAVLFGILYNIRSKKDIFSPVYISLSLIYLILFSYFARAGRITDVLILVIAYFFFQMMFQIGIEGYMKDIRSDQKSLIGYLGTRYHPPGTIRVSGWTHVIAWTLKTINYIIFGILWLKPDPDFLVLTVGLVIIAGTSLAAVKLLKSGTYDNKQRVRMCALIEVLSYTLLILALKDMLNTGLLLFFLIYPFAWFLILNRLTWKTWITPRV